MVDRLEMILKVSCLALAALLFFQFARLGTRLNPLGHLKIPALPTWSAANNASTNAPATNVAIAMPPTGNTNQGAGATNINAALNLSSNKNGTNVMPGTAVEKTPTNSVARQTSRPRMSGAMPPQMAGNKAPDLPATIQSRVGRITESEILGPVIRPMPMALLGIAGNVAFLRDPKGQTGLVKEGDVLGEIKLLQIGINRVLIEHEGQKKELIIFAGLGSESLLPKQKENP
jgi:hypothetical protein